MASDEKLVDYVKACLSAGRKTNDVIADLKKAGWKSEQIALALEEVLKQMDAAEELQKAQELKKQKEGSGVKSSVSQTQQKPVEKQSVQKTGAKNVSASFQKKEVGENDSSLRLLSVIALALIGFFVIFGTLYWALGFSTPSSGCTGFADFNCVDYKVTPSSAVLILESRFDSSVEMVLPQCSPSFVAANERTSCVFDGSFNDGDRQVVLVEYESSSGVRGNDSGYFNVVFE
ncbi:MAG: hypothetical protein ACE5DI_03855 [Candidatus Micrarchaeia archaeon]